MSDFLNRLKRAAKAAASEWQPARYKVADIQVVCPHCGNDTFAEGRALLNTAGMSFIGLDWANSDATTLSCTKCSRIQWFHQTVHETQGATKSSNTVNPAPR